MKLNAAILLGATLAASLPSALAQSKASAPPDPATVKRLQAEIASNEARGNLQSASVELRLLVSMYKDDPSMRSSLYSQLAQISTQLHDDKKAAEYRSLAQGAAAQPAAAPAPRPQVSAAPVATAPANAAPVASASFPTPQPLAPQAAGSPQVSPDPTAPKPSSTDKFSKFLSQAKQILAQAQAMKLKGSATPQPDQPAAGGFPSPPAGGAAAAPAAPQDASAAPASTGVVIGYDANNQPIFAPAPPPAAAPAAPNSGVVIGYDANNQPIFAPAPPPPAPAK